MIYAQIKNNTVINTIVLDKVELEPIFANGFDALVRIDNLDIIPGINWSYINGEFISPNQQDEAS